MKDWKVILSDTADVDVKVIGEEVKLVKATLRGGDDYIVASLNLLTTALLCC